MGCDAGSLLKWVCHERYDGNGYPLRLKGEDIPLCTRIMAVADVLDALLSKRQYKEPYSLDHSREIMSVEYGRQFDPVVLAALLDNWDEFIALYYRKNTGSPKDEAALAAR